jgi:hypothetical protein
MFRLGIIRWVHEFCKRPSYMESAQHSQHSEYSKGWGRGFDSWHCVQTGSGTHPESYPMNSGQSFPEGKAARTWSWVGISPPSSTEVNLWSYTSSRNGARLSTGYVMVLYLIKHRDNFALRFT